MNKDEILQFALDNGMLDLATIQEQIKMNEDLKFLKRHRYKIWQGKNGLYYTYLPDDTKKDNRRLVKRKSLEDLNEAIIEFNRAKESGEFLHIDDIFYLWAESKINYGEIEQQTYDRYETDFHRFFDNSLLIDKKFSDIDEDDLEEFIKVSIYENQLTAKAWSNLRLLLNGMFKYAKKYKLTAISISSFINDLDLAKKAFARKKKKSQDEEVFTDKEASLIINYILSKKCTLIELGILLDFETGLRLGELAALEFSDIKHNAIEVRKTEISFKDPDTRKKVVTIRNYPKSEAGERSVILTDDAIKIISILKQVNPNGANGFLFMKDNKRVKGKAFTDRIKRICSNLGITPKSIQKVRRTFATKLIDAGVADSIIMDLMGHTDITTTRRYYYRNNKVTTEIIDTVNNAIKYDAG